MRSVQSCAADTVGSAVPMDLAGPTRAFGPDENLLGFAIVLRQSGDREAGGFLGDRNDHAAFDPDLFLGNSQIELAALIGTHV